MRGGVRAMPTNEFMRIPMEKLRKVIEIAERKDLDDDLLVDWNEEYMNITLWLNEKAWNEFKKSISIETIPR